MSWRIQVETSALVIHDVIDVPALENFAKDAMCDSVTVVNELLTFLQIYFVAVCI